HGVSAAPPQNTGSLNCEKTWIEMRSAPGATPLKSGPRPAAMPATSVPWLQPSIEGEQACPDPGSVDDVPPGVEGAPGHKLTAKALGSLLEKHASPTTLEAPVPSCRNGWSFSMPVSMTTMTMPVPS